MYFVFIDYAKYNVMVHNLLLEMVVTSFTLAKTPARKGQLVHVRWKASVILAKLQLGVIVLFCLTTKTISLGGTSELT